MTLPPDYLERTYAGVLGKIIGVYLGRPFEGWSYERIMAELGEITDYIHDKLKMPLIVTDDDISGTFTFLRALPDYGNTADLTPQQIGQTWLNYIIEKKTILWWGGLGNSTEHTAYLRLKQGISAPKSGSTELNSKVVAEQIGAQIFIDGWGMVCPGDPEKAADFARRAGSVSHDGEAVYGAQIIAALEAHAYVEPDLNVLLDTATKLIPQDSIIYRLINDIREWHAEFADWHNTRDQIVSNYGYDKYGGGCHIVPNHALIIMSLLHGADDFDKSLMMVNTSGWDTDCNSGNVGCLLGIKNGLATISPKWREPVADRIYLPTAEGGSAITDAVIQTYNVVNIGRALVGEAPLHPKDNARFHFELPGSVQGFRSASNHLHLENVSGHSQSGTRSLAFHLSDLQSGQSVEATTPTFIPSEAVNMSGYTLVACPTLYPGQNVEAVLTADEKNSSTLKARLILNYYGANDQLTRAESTFTLLNPAETVKLEWLIPDFNGAPIAEIGLALYTDQPTNGNLYLDYVKWSGEPNTVLKKPSDKSTLWQRAWVDGTDNLSWGYPESYRVVQNYGTGLLIQGTRDWKNYEVSADVTPHMVKGAGVAARVQGLERYYALVLQNNDTAALIKRLDGEHILASLLYGWSFGITYQLRLRVHDARLSAWINDVQLFEVYDADLADGAIALLCREGRTYTHEVHIRPA